RGSAGTSRELEGVRRIALRRKALRPGLRARSRLVRDLHPAVEDTARIAGIDRLRRNLNAVRHRVDAAGDMQSSGRVQEHDVPVRALRSGEDLLGDRAVPFHVAAGEVLLLRTPEPERRG